MEATGIEAIREFDDFSGLLDLSLEQEDEGQSGLVCELQTFDARYNSRGERVVLDIGYKKDFQVEPPKQKGHKSALVLTRFFDKCKEIEYTELEIRSPYVKAALKAVVPEFRDINLQTRKIILRDQLQCLFHHRQELQAYGATLQDPEAVHHLLFVLRYMYKMLQDEVYTYYNLVEMTTMRPSIDFLNLWMIIRPGDYIYVLTGKSESGLKFKSMSRCKCPLARRCLSCSWVLSYEYIDYDGTNFGYSNTLLNIAPYHGYKSIETLPVVPLQYCQEKSRIRAAMVARGKKFVALHGKHHRVYDEGVVELLAPNRICGIFGEEDEFPQQSTLVRRAPVRCKPSLTPGRLRGAL
jgi:hypothetical protein